MAIVNKQDTDGTKPVLAKGELGYDDYAAGGDAGRVYVGNGSINIALAKKSEVEANATALSDHAGSTTAHANATTTDNGFMSSVDKSKLDNVEAGANNYSLPASVVHETDYATPTVGGSVKVGTDFEIASGLLSLLLKNFDISYMKDYAPGVNPIRESSVESFHNDDSWLKKREVRVGRVGTITTKFTLARHGNSRNIYGRIYVNGVATGAQRATNSTSYVTFTEDITINPGDLVQLYLYGYKDGLDISSAKSNLFSLGVAEVGINDYSSELIL